MGCDIHAYAEWRGEDGKWNKVGDVFPLDDWAKKYFGKDYGDEPFEVRNYGVFGFLAGVRNYSDVPVIAEPRGLPDDLSPEVTAQWDEWQHDGHTASWLSRDELIAFDYDATFEDRRAEGGSTAVPGLGATTTFRVFLGAAFFRDLDALKAIEAPDVRVVYWFDN